MRLDNRIKWVPSSCEVVVVPDAVLLGKRELPARIESLEEDRGSLSWRCKAAGGVANVLNQLQ